jgi:hypothetical protein
MARGTFQGLLAYQMEVDEKREKLKEKIAERRFELQKLMIKVGATGGGRGGGSKSRAKMDEYYKSMAILRNRLLGEDDKLVEGANQFLSEVALSPSVASDIVSYIEQMDEESKDAFMGGVTSPEEILNLGTILKVRDKELLGSYISSGEMATMLEDRNLSDDDTWMSNVTRLSTYRPPTTIPAAYAFIPNTRESFPALKPEQIKGQVDVFIKNIADQIENPAQRNAFVKTSKEDNLTLGLDVLTREDPNVPNLDKNELIKNAIEGFYDSEGRINPFMRGVETNPILMSLFTSMSTATPSVPTSNLPNMTQRPDGTYSLID